MRPLIKARMLWTLPQNDKKLQLKKKLIKDMPNKFALIEGSKNSANSFKTAQNCFFPPERQHSKAHFTDFPRSYSILSINKN